eukprot:TRINITY_DN7212_c0_g1_i1.p1 TRINITY_DN7212_c0_g1~~TRINITY_DN7212_c0_g1_i1.p1  ORF type:complete len:837 (+),score=138.31 TRINITY_DN7212_c0_g1_i1:32-2512(+)
MVELTIQPDEEQPPVDNAVLDAEEKNRLSALSQMSEYSDRRLGVSSIPDSDSDCSAENVWVANYERKQFRAVSLVPPVTWLPAYVRCIMGRGTEQDTLGAGALPYSLQNDMIAGLTVGFMLVPQCLAFALLAGLPVNVGLYASFGPLVVYALFGTIRQVQPGPTALMSLLTGQALDSMGLVMPEDRLHAAAVLALLVGGVSVLLGVIRFGFVVDFMSHSVMTAFCSAAGVTIITSQLKHLFGIHLQREKYWWKTVGKLITYAGETDVPTAVMGCTILFFLLLLKHWKSAGSLEKREKHMVWRWFPKKKGTKGFKALKLVADMSSLGAVLIGWSWGFVYRSAGINSVKLVGEVDSKGFIFILPGVSLPDDFDLSSAFLSAAIMAIVGFLETVAVGGKFANEARYEYDPNQELLALGLANIAGAVMSGYPTTGSFSRTAVNAMLGATSLVACALTSTVVLFAVLFLLPVIELLPMAALAPIIIQGALSVVTVKDFKTAWFASRMEFVVMFSTFVVSLYMSVKEGLLVGFVLSVLKTMHDLANPNLAVCGMLEDGSFRDIRNFPDSVVIPGAVIVRMDARLSFANARKMKEFSLRAVAVRERNQEKISYVIVDGKSINHVDLTGCEMLHVLAESLETRGQKLIVANLKGPVSKYLDLAGAPKAIRKHGGYLCIDMQQAIEIVNGADPEAAQARVQELVRRVDNARLVLRSNNSHLYKCGSYSGSVAANVSSIASVTNVRTSSSSFDSCNGDSTSPRSAASQRSFTLSPKSPKHEKHKEKEKGREACGSLEKHRPRLEERLPTSGEDPSKDAPNGGTVIAKAEQLQEVAV